MADFRQLFWIEQDKYLSLNKRKIHDETEMTTDIAIADGSWWLCHGSGLMITREMGGLSICMPSSPINVCEDYRTKECRAERDTIRLENFLSPQGVRIRTVIIHRALPVRGNLYKLWGLMVSLTHKRSAVWSSLLCPELVKHVSIWEEYIVTCFYSVLK